MTVTSKKKLAKKKAPVLKTKTAKKKAAGSKKDKVAKKKKTVDIQKKIKDTKKEIKKVVKEQTVMTKKQKTGKKKKKDTEAQIEEKVLIQKKKKVEGKKKKRKDTQEEEKMDIEEQAMEETDNSECEEKEDDDESEEEEIEEEDNDESLIGDKSNVSIEEEDEEDSEDGDDEEDDDDEDDDDDEEDEGYEESPVKDATMQSPQSTEKSTVNKHVVFDDDETFENLPALTSAVTAEPSNLDLDEESDSDAPPEEGTLSMGKDIFADEDKKMKSELVKLKNQVKEARRLKHEKNREQQMKKRQRLQTLEKSRLPTDLLDAVAKEKTEPKKVSIKEQKGKRKTFDDDKGDLGDDELFAEAGDDENLITLDRSVKVRAVQQEVKKYKTIASIASDFRQKALYKSKYPRMTSLAQRQMIVKQEKSGKNLLAS